MSGSPAGVLQRLLECEKRIPDPGDAGTIKADRDLGVCALTTGASNETRTVGNPDDIGVRMAICMEVDGGGDAVLTFSSAYDEAGTTSMTFSATGQVAFLESVAQGARTYVWRVKGYDGVTGPTTALATISVGAITGNDSSLGITGQAAAQGGAVAIVGGTSSTSGNAGGAVTVTGGTPGATGVGGAVTLTAGAGGATSGSGGAASLVGGAGTGTGTAGGTAALTSGAGVAHTTGTGGASGAVTISSGAAGTATTGTGGAGGTVAVTGGAGGAATGAAGIGGAGAAVQITSGAGGAASDSSSGNAGAGGASYLRSGAGGAATGTGGAAGGAGGAADVTATRSVSKHR